MTIGVKVVFLRPNTMAREPNVLDDETLAKMVMDGCEKPLAQIGGYIATTAHRLTNKRPRNAFYREMEPAVAKARRKATRNAKKLGKRPPTKIKVGSAPGEPPRKHTGHLTNNMRFGVEPANATLTMRSVVAGPTPLRAAPKVPRTLEEGGPSVITTFVSRTGFQLAFARKAQKTAKRETATYIIAPRPYMTTSLDKSRRMISTAFRNILN